VTQKELDLIGRPAYFYRRVIPSGPEMYVIHQVDRHYHFLLRHVVAKWAQQAGHIPPIPITFQLVVGGQGIPFSPAYLPAELVVSPSSVDVSALPDFQSFLNLTATPLKLPADADFAFQFREVIEVRMRGFRRLAPHWYPRILDLLLIGQYYPLESQEGMGPR
jgi:hypothetical protein